MDQIRLGAGFCVAADSCYSGTLTRGVRKLRADDAHLARIASLRARVALTSGGLEPVEDGRGGDHSVFAKAIIDALVENDGIMEGAALFAGIRRSVVLNAAQTPGYGDIRFAGHDGGDFLFARRRQGRTP